jgi:hypothetical protein
MLIWIPIQVHRILILLNIRPDIRLIQKPDTGYLAGYLVGAGHPA